MSAEQDQAGLSLKRIYRGLDQWFHEPRDPALFAAVRISMGLLVLLNFVCTAPYVEMWWSEHGFLPFEASKRTVSIHAVTLFDWLPHTDTVLWTCWGIAVAQAALLTVGLFSRFQAVCVYLWLITFDHRNGVILDGEDTVYRLFTFFVILMPLADVWSVDAWIKRKLKGPSEPRRRDGWALRLMQIQVCIILWSAGLEKLEGSMWWDGSAMYYVLHLDDFATHLPVPDFVRDSLLLSRAMTWSSLWIEIAAPILIFFKETRRAALIAVIGLHLGIEYMMNLFWFEWIMLVGWATHLRSEDLAWLRSLWARLRGTAEAAPASAATAPAQRSS